MKAAFRAKCGSYTYSQEVQENVLSPGMEITAIGRVRLASMQQVLARLPTDMQSFKQICDMVV